MTRIELDGAAMHRAQDFYAQIRCHPATPGWFGGNRDALFDLLVAIWEPPVAIRWHGASRAREQMGAEFAQLVEVIEDAAAYCAERGRMLELELIEAEQPVAAER